MFKCPIRGSNSVFVTERRYCRYRLGKLYLFDQNKAAMSEGEGAEETGLGLRYALGL